MSLQDRENFKANRRCFYEALAELHIYSDSFPRISIEGVTGHEWGARPSVIWEGEDCYSVIFDLKAGESTIPVYVRVYLAVDGEAEKAIEVCKKLLPMRF